MARTIESNAVRRPALPFLVVGISPQSVLGRHLADKFRSSVRFPPGITEACGLVVALHSFGDREGRRTFASSAQRSGTPTLHVALDGPEALIGPLAVPGLAGCGHCAWARIFAAGVYRNKKEFAIHDRVEGVVGRLLSREIRSVLKDIGSSQLRKHVLAVDAESGKASLHRFIPLAQCPVCGGASVHPLSERRHPELSAEDDPGTVPECSGRLGRSPYGRAAANRGRKAKR